jgi:hypothetical protein
MHIPRLLLVLLVALLYAGGLTLAQGDSTAHGHGDTSAEAHDDHDHDDDHDHAHDDDHGHDDDHDHDHDHDDDHDDHDHDHGGDHDHDDAGVVGLRVLVAAADRPLAVVIDLATGAELGRFTLPGLARAYQLPEPRFGVLLHRDENRVTFIHSGLSAVDHGGHMDLLEESPYVLQTLNVGRGPTHFFARGNDIALYNDVGGTIAWLDARLLGVSLDYVEVAAEIDHGSVAIVGGTILAGYSRAGRVDAFDRDGSLLASFDDCPSAHGQAVSGTTVAFGCRDGVLLVDVADDRAITSTKLMSPAGSPEGARVDTLVSDDHGSVIVGTFGSGVALIDVGARTLTVVALPANPIALRMSGHDLIVLTADGYLHRLSEDGVVEASLEVAHAVVPGEPRASLAVLGDWAVVGDPDHGELVLVDLHEMVIEARMQLDFAPGGVVLLAIPGAVTH